MTGKPTSLAALAQCLLDWPDTGRILVAIAGPPGVGKSTVARALCLRLNRACMGGGALLEMDGFHYDDRLLASLGRLKRKGAPDTFDVNGLAHILVRLRDPAEGAVAVPVFDRKSEIVRAGAALIPPEVRVVIVEGNYLLLDLPPWDRLAKTFDLTVMLRASPETLRRRLLARWLDLGLGADDARKKVEKNDLPNGALVMSASRPARYELETEDQSQ